MDASILGGNKVRGESSGFVHLPEYQQGERDKERDRGRGSRDWEVYST